MSKSAGTAIFSGMRYWIINGKAELLASRYIELWGEYESDFNRFGWPEYHGNVGESRISVLESGKQIDMYLQFLNLALLNSSMSRSSFFMCKRLLFFCILKGLLKICYDCSNWLAICMYDI